MNLKKVFLVTVAGLIRDTAYSLRSDVSVIERCHLQGSRIDCGTRHDRFGICRSITIAEHGIKIEYFSVSAARMSARSANLEFENSTEITSGSSAQRKGRECLGHGSTGGR